jgi:peptidase E
MPGPLRQIIAVGGGGLSPELDGTRLVRYVLAQTRTRKPAVCFLPTANGDDPGAVDRFYAAFSVRRCRPSHVPLFGRTPDLRQALLTQDVLYVGGGNTKSMLATWEEWGIPVLLRRAWRSGIVLAGVSAGAICWFKMGVTDSWADRLAVLPCLGLLPGTLCPHFDSEPERRPSLHRFIVDGTATKALALDDGAAAHYVDRALARVVTFRPHAGAYHVHRRGTGVVETALPVVRLR